MWHCWICGTVEWDIMLKRLEYWNCHIVEYCLDCWMRYDFESR